MSRAALSIRHQRGKSLRAQVFARDKGVCAQCKCDTQANKEDLAAIIKTTAGTRLAAWALELKRHLADSAQWEADHERALALGGADSIDNARTLCRPCHRIKTAEDAARIARMPNKMRAAR